MNELANLDGRVWHRIHGAGNDGQEPAWKSAVEVGGGPLVGAIGLLVALLILMPEGVSAIAAGCDPAGRMRPADCWSCPCAADA